MIKPDFERRLVENTQPIRNFVLAQAIHHAFDLGVFAAIDASGGISAPDLAVKLDLESERLLGLLQFLQNEGYLVDDKGWRITGKGHELQEFAPWYEMLVGGYATTFVQLGDTLRKGAPWATRNATKVGAGSCGIGIYDAVPLVGRLLDGTDRPLRTIVDLGCGDALFLTDILRDRAELSGIGMDPNAASIALGETHAVTAGVEDRMELQQGEAQDVVKLKLRDGGDGVCFLTAFILQEVLEQEGEATVENLLRDTFETYPNAVWAVVEMDHKPTSAAMRHGLAMAFYNPYFLIHAITEQRLETKEYWAEMFERLGLKTVAFDTPDERADSTGLQFGFLLAKA